MTPDYSWRNARLIEYHNSQWTSSWRLRVP